MGKWAVLILIVLVVYVAMKSLARRQPSPPPQGRLAEDMVQCRECGLHLPRSEAFEHDGHYLCGKDHRRDDA